jgi:hypothetical protein
MKPDPAPDRPKKLFGLRNVVLDRHRLPSSNKNTKKHKRPKKENKNTKKKKQKNKNTNTNEQTKQT